MPARTSLKRMLFITAISGVALAGCDASPTASSDRPAENTQSSDWRTITNPDGSVIRFRYLTVFQRTDTAKFQIACRDTAHAVIIAPDAHDPLTLSTPGVYAAVADSVRRDYIGTTDPTPLPGDTVQVPAYHTLIWFEHHDLWVGTVYVELWVPEAQGHVLGGEQNFSLLWHPRFRGTPLLRRCHDQGGGAGS